MAKHGSTGGSHHTPTGSHHPSSGSKPHPSGGAPTHHESKKPTTTHGEGTHNFGPKAGGKGARVNMESLGTMEGHLGRTRDKVDGVGHRVAGANFGHESMGVLGTGMTGSLNSTVEAAKAQVAKTSKSVDAAGAKTKAALQRYETNELNTVEALNKTGKEVKAPPVKEGSTVPSNAGKTTPGSAGGSPPNNPPPGGGPPEGVGGGARPPGGHSTPSTSAPPPWREEIQQRFSPSEQRELDTAFQKMAAEPGAGEVGGSGKLTQRERELVAEAQKLVTITPGTVMQKVIDPRDVDKYLDNTYREVGGFVARRQDATHMRTPDDLVQGNRLDYRGGPYGKGMSEVHVIEFAARDPDNYRIPFGAPHGGPSGLPDGDPSVQRARDHMLTDAGRAGLPRGSYYDHHQEWPYSGIGVTADAKMGIPERVITDRQKFSDGDMMYKYTANGDKVPVARFNAASGRWEDA